MPAFFENNEDSAEKSYPEIEDPKIDYPEIEDPFAEALVSFNTPTLAIQN